jgi:hypothetical protein
MSGPSPLRRTTTTTNRGNLFPRGTRTRLICEIAVATNTAPSQWWDEPADVLATVVEILDDVRKEIKKKGRKHG